MRKRRSFMGSLLVLLIVCACISDLKVLAKEDPTEELNVRIIGVSRADTLSNGKQAFHLKSVIEPDATYMVQAVITNYADEDVENAHIELRLPAEIRAGGMALDDAKMELALKVDEDAQHDLLWGYSLADDVTLETDAANLAIEYISSSGIMSTSKIDGEGRWESNIWTGSLGRATDISPTGATYLSAWRDLPAKSTIVLSWGFRTYDLKAYKLKQESMEPLGVYCQGIYAIPERLSSRLVAETEAFWTSEDCWRILQGGKIDTTTEALPEKYAVIAAVDIPQWLPENDNGENRWVLRTNIRLSYHDGREIAPDDWLKTKDGLDGYRVVAELDNCQLIYEAADTSDYWVQQDDILGRTADVVEVLYWNSQTGKTVPMKDTQRVRDAFGTGYAINQEDGFEAGEQAFIVFICSQ